MKIEQPARLRQLVEALTHRLTERTQHPRQHQQAQATSNLPVRTGIKAGEGAVLPLLLAAGRL